MSEKPPYWDSWRGQVIRAILSSDKKTWAEVRERSGLSQKQLYRTMGRLMKRDITDFAQNDNDEKTYFVKDKEIERIYLSAMKDTGQREVIEPKKQYSRHTDWIQKWIDMHEDIDASLEDSHFFLEGTQLADFSRNLIKRAQKLMIVNPFVDRAGLGTVLRTASKKGVHAILITRRPKSKPERTKFHQTLKGGGVDLYYSGHDPGGVHSKLIIADDEVAIISSMNFTKDSEAAVTWETGIVTLSKAVVASAMEAVKDLRDQEETSPA